MHMHTYRRLRWIFLKLTDKRITLFIMAYMLPHTLLVDPPIHFVLTLLFISSTILLDCMHSRTLSRNMYDSLLCIDVRCTYVYLSPYVPICVYDFPISSICTQFLSIFTAQTPRRYEIYVLPNTYAPTQIIRANNPRICVLLHVCTLLI